jgi:glycosyltransferase involved in cell wall biosynthesis
MTRVLHVVASAKLRGAEIFASDLVRALAADGVTQRVALLRGSARVAVRYDAPTDMPRRDGVALPGLRIDLRSLADLRRLMKDWRPDVVQAHGGETLKYALPAAAAAGGPPVVYRSIGLVAPWATRGARRLAWAGLARRAARTVVVAESVGRQVTRVFGLPPSKILRIPNAVDAQRVRPSRPSGETREALGIRPRAPVITSVGALTWEKDPVGQLGVAERIIRAIPEAVFCLVGEGPLAGQVQAGAIDRGLDGRVRLLGARTDVADLLAMSDVLLLASAIEGMPASVIEAGMAGLPVAAYAIAGVPEVVEDGVTGRLVTPGDAEGLARAALGLIEDATTHEAMGRAARERCTTRFDISAVAPSYLALYRELEDGHAGRPA